MCGLAGNLSFGDVRSTPEQLKHMLVTQQIRGRDATGIAYYTESQIHVNKSNVEPQTFVVKDLSSAQWKTVAASPIVLMHARHATQGHQSNNENNHPVVACDWVVVHNGHVRNDKELIQFYGMADERPAEVDTVVINMALAQGETAEESISHLSMLGGAATFMAWNVHRPQELLIGRINGPALFMHLDRRDRILYWSSDTDGLRPTGRMGIGDLKFINVAAMPQNTVFWYTGEEFRQYKLDLNPFNLPKPIKESSYLPAHYRGKEKGKGTSSPLVLATNFHDNEIAAHTEIGGEASPMYPIGNFPASSTDSGLTALLGKWMNQVRDNLLADDDPFLLTDTMAIAIHENYTTLKKPAPNFEPGMIGVAAFPPKKVETYTTPYGTWFLTPNNRWFRGAKRIKAHWGKIREETGLSVLLPASAEFQNAVRGYYRLEVIKLYDDKAESNYTLLLMCPWCGIIAKPQQWQMNGYTCVWCKVRSNLRYSQSAEASSNSVKE